MGDRLAQTEGVLFFSPHRIAVNPGVIFRGIAERINPFLVNEYPMREAEVRPREILDGVDIVDQNCHAFLSDPGKSVSSWHMAITDLAPATKMAAVPQRDKKRCRKKNPPFLFVMKPNENRPEDHTAEMPPFTLMTCPVISDASGLARNTMRWAMSSGLVRPRCAALAAFLNNLPANSLAMIFS